MSLDAHHAPLRGETAAPASTWRPVTDDLRVRHVAFAGLRKFDGRETRFVNAVLDHMAREAHPEAF
mgnify:CR=1 FL=1